MALKNVFHRARWWWIPTAVVMLIAGGIVLWFFITFFWEMGTQAVLLPSVERRIGAEIRSPELKLGGEGHEVMAFENVGPGACARAGIMEGDIIVSHRTIGQLCRLLRGPKGTQVTVEVAPGGDGPPLAERVKRKVTITLP
jgi:hypothetical protein